MSSISEVARKAGVAKSTVTKVMKNYPNISDVTRTKVMEAAKELAYVPNIFASELSSKNIKRIGLIIDDLNGINTNNLIYIKNSFKLSMEMNLKINLILKSMILDMTSEEIDHYLRAQGINALMIFELKENDEKLISLTKAFKTVLIDSYYQADNVSLVNFKHNELIYECLKESMEDHHKALMIMNDRYKSNNKLKLSGLSKLCQDYHIQLEVTYIDHVLDRVKDIIKCSANEFDIIITEDSVIALMVINALKEMDIFKNVCAYQKEAITSCIDKGIGYINFNYSELIKKGLEEINRLLDGNQSQVIYID